MDKINKVNVRPEEANKITVVGHRKGLGIENCLACGVDALVVRVQISACVSGLYYHNQLPTTSTTIFLPQNIFFEIRDQFRSSFRTLCVQHS